MAPDLRFEVSQRIKQEFENGTEYYQLNGAEIWVPRSHQAQPDPKALAWHNENCFR